MTRAYTAALLAVGSAGLILTLTFTDNPASWVASAQEAKAKKDPMPVARPPARPAAATAVESLKVLKGFKAELLYTVPKDLEGSWVSLCADPKGRLIVCDQYGGLFRVTPPAVGGKPDETKIEKLPAPIGEAQGLLWAFDALYVVVNKGQKYESGLYRVTASKGDDALDKVELLRKIDGAGEHGPHAVIPNPDGKRLTIVCGNATKPMEVQSSRVPPVYGEDHLLPRLPDGNGFMKGVLAPGGCVYNITPDGKDWELVSIGFRNEYDSAYNRNGDLFTYDADMEWDFNTPWYRPTRVCHVVSGSDWGWRNGAGKYPPFYPDTLPPVVEVGPGSPTGITFGYGAKFPAKYQDALFICDWSYGKLYAVHMTPKGASYTGTLEEFVSGTPLPFTDIVVNPTDGALYFTVGGRKTQSGLYRVTYTGGEPTETPLPETTNTNVAERRYLEAFHARGNPKAVNATWPDLANKDRFIRSAARTALEWQPVDTWRDRALAETEPESALTALLALARVSAPDPFHRKPSDPPIDSALRAKLLDAFGRLDFAKLSPEQRLELARVYQVTLNRFQPPTEAERTTLLARFNATFPSGNRYLDGMLLELLVFLQDPAVAPKAMKLLADAPTQEEQLEYVRSLRMLRAGWTPELKTAYFEWFVRAGGYKGGNSFQGFLRLIKADAVAALTPEEKAALKPVLEAQPAPATTPAAPARAFVKKWTVDELAPAVEKGLKAGGRDFDRGRRLFGAASCFGCHRYDNEGGSAGPDLTGIAGRFSTRDLLESILDPSKEVSDQYAAVEIDTLDGKKVVGRIINLNGDTYYVNTNMLDPNGIVNVDRNNVDVMKPSRLSMMPAGLLDTLREAEVIDLAAYLLSRGDRANAVFKK